MPEASIVAIASADRLPQLKERIGVVDGELLSFTDADALSALETIVRLQPKMVALERLFAATPRGAALINRIKADKNLNDIEIKVFAHDSNNVRVVPRLDLAAPPALDQRGTRRAPRVKMSANATAVVDGKTASLIDLSVIGAQVIAPLALKVNQQVSFTLVDKDANLRFEAKIAWTSYDVQPDTGFRYRAGVEFIDADAGEIDAFCQRNKAG